MPASSLVLLLKKFYSDEADEPVFELTTGAERAIQWLEDLQARPFVGAESRLELVFRQLEEILLFSTPDVERRVVALRAQQAALQAQIESIEATNTAQAYTAVQLTERFANALDLARGLTGDFRQLEENFKEVARALAEAQTKPGTTKGRIVGQLLDTHAALKDSAQVGRLGRHIPLEWDYWYYRSADISPDLSAHEGGITTTLSVALFRPSLTKDSRLPQGIARRVSGAIRG